MSGYIAAGVAAVFFGSNYVPMKKFPVGDGFVFQWVMSTGILMVGIASLAFNRQARFEMTGILGGAVWALGNALVIPILQTVGLGVGFLMWSGTSLILGYTVGRFGLFGVDAESPERWYLSYVGLLSAVVALVIFFFVKPDLSDGSETTGEAEDLEDGKDAEGIPISVSHVGASSGDDAIGREVSDASVQRSLFIDEDTAELGQADDREEGFRGEDDLHFVDWTTVEHPLWRLVLRFLPHSFQDGVWRLKRFLRPFARFAGLLMGIWAGMCYGVTLVPYDLWNQRMKLEHIDVGPLDFLFCYTVGIFCMASVILLLYLLVAWPPQIYPKATLPSILCGMGWAVASAGWMIATGSLGFTVGFPIVVIGPILVTMFWTIFVFREIRGIRNYILVVCSMFFILVAVACFALSK